MCVVDRLASISVLLEDYARSRDRLSELNAAEVSVPSPPHKSRFHKAIPVPTYYSLARLAALLGQEPWPLVKVSIKGADF